MALTSVQVASPASRKWMRHSHSSHADLVSCEKKYYWRKIAKVEAEPTKAMSKGSLFHRLVGAWWLTDTVEDELLVFLAEWRAEHTILDEDSGELVVAPLPEWVDDIYWLVKRYIEFYGPHRDDWEVLGVEVPFEVRIPGRYAYLTGRFDALVRERSSGRIWVVEWKTCSGWDSIEEYAWSPQVSLYYWAAREAGYDIEGVLIDAAYTYRWKNPRPLQDSFQRRWLDRNEEHLEGALAELDGGMVRARELRNGAFPLRNIDRHCGWCSYRDLCRNDLAFGAETNLEWNEDE